MSAVAGSRGRRSDPLKKKIPENPKYKHVRATVDTGASLSKYIDKIEHIKKNYKFRKNELFKRMKATTFVQLVIQVHRIASEDIYDDIPPTPASLAETYSAEQELDFARGDGSPVPSLTLTEGDYGAKSEIDTQRSTLFSVTRGFGELDVNQPPPVPKNKFVDDTCPYLLLDIRDKDEFDQCHIISATSYPKAMLSRACNYDTEEMRKYKNKPGKIIVIYDDDERLAHEAATTLVQRQYENLFMLSGGLKVALQKFPDGLTTGTPPAHLVTPPPKSKGKPPKIPALQKQFTADDIDNMDMYLDSLLEDQSTGGRLSKSSTASSRMSKASSRCSTVSQAPAHLQDRPAFKPV